MPHSAVLKHREGDNKGKSSRRGGASGPPDHGVSFLQCLGTWDLTCVPVNLYELQPPNTGKISHPTLEAMCRFKYNLQTAFQKDSSTFPLQEKIPGDNRKALKDLKNCLVRFML